MKRILKKAASFRRPVVKKYRQISTKTLIFIDKRPIRSFLILLGVVLGLIIISNSLPQAKKEAPKVEIVKTVKLYRIGKAARISAQAQIKKTGVIQITAQAPGIISFIHKFEGESVSKGTLLVSISSNYYGGNSTSLQRQIAQKQYEGVSATYPTQKEVIQKQKEQAQKSDENSDLLRDITSKSNQETQNLITLNEQILKTLDEDLAKLQLDPTTNRQLILTTQQLKSQYLASTNQAKAALRSSEFQSASDKPSAQLSDLTREITIKQLEIQEKQLDINKEISKLQLALAQVNEAIYFPTAPFSGIVERVFVKPFESVNLGTPLFIISQTKEEDPITAIAFVSKDIAQRVSLLEESILHLGNTTYATRPYFISTEAVQGTLYAIYYPLPEELSPAVVSGGYITVDIPVGYPDTAGAAPFVPIDAIYQTQTNSYLFVEEDKKAKSREVKLGQVFGSFVEIESGIETGDSIILNRNIIEGDKVQAE